MKAAWPLALLPVALCSAGDFYGSDAYSGLRRSHISVAAERKWDLDGDGKLETVVVERHGQSLAVSVWREAQTGFVLMGRTARLPADDFVRLEQVQLGKHLVLWWEVAQQNPDEEDRTTFIVLFRQGRLLPLLEQQYRVVHPESEAGRPARRLLRLGPDTAGWQVASTTGEWPELILHDEPKLLMLLDRRKEPLWLSVGMRRRLYRFSGTGYKLASTKFQDFVKPLRARPSDCTSGHLCISATGEALLRLVWMETTGCCEGVSCTPPLELVVDTDTYRIHEDLSIDGPADLAAAGSFVDKARSGAAQVLAVFIPPRRWSRVKFRPLRPHDKRKGCIGPVRLFADAHRAALEKL